MIPKFVRTLLIGLAAAALLLTALVPAATAHSSPRLDLAVSQAVTGGVTAGSSQGFDVVITNEGRHRIRSVYLWTNLREATTYVDASEDGCAPVGKRLWCRFGPLRSGESVTVTVAYTVPFSTGAGGIVFKASPGWHHDRVVNEQVVRILAPDNENSAATFVTGTSYKVANVQKVGRGNPQATRVVGKGQFIPVSVKDGAKVSFDCPASVCTATPLGQWSQVNVGDGATFEQAFKVRIRIADRKVPNDLDPRDLVVYHVLDDGTVDTISRPCNGHVPTGDEPECRTVRLTPSGNLVINVFTYKNGGYKGAF